MQCTRCCCSFNLKRSGVFGDLLTRVQEFEDVNNICQDFGMVLLENDAFLVELNKFFEKSRQAGSVSLTIKRFNGHNKPEPREGRPPLPPPSEYLCLARANYKSKKLSTIIHSKDINKFQQAYWNLLKTNLNGLKKLKKIKTVKPKAY